MGRKYTLTDAGTAVTAAVDICEILSPTDAVTVIHEWSVYQTTDVGDAAEEILTIQTVRGVGTVTSGNGTATTPQPVEDGDTAYGGTCERFGTTRMAAGTGTLETLSNEGWNVRVPTTKTYTPETRPVISPGNRWTLSLPSAPADSLTIGFTVVLEEIGG